MIRLSLITPRTLFSKIKASLKLLQITPPTNKKEIKKKYLEMAKSLHPDIKEEEGKAKSANQIKEDSLLFVEVTKAYKHLSELSEEEINNPDKEYEQQSPSNESGGQQSSEGRQISEEQRRRQATYSFFNRKSTGNENKQDEIPMYKKIPQIFVGIILALMFVGECGYIAYTRTKQNLSRSDPANFSKTFQNLNFKQKFDKNEQIIEADTQKF